MKGLTNYQKTNIKNLKVYVLKRGSKKVIAPKTLNEVFKFLRLEGKDKKELIIIHNLVLKYTNSELRSLDEQIENEKEMNEKIRLFNKKRNLLYSKECILSIVKQMITNINNGVYETVPYRI